MNQKEFMSMKMDSLSQNEEFARVVTAVFASRLDPTLEELDDIKTAVSEAVTNAVIHGYKNGEGVIELSAEAEIRELSENILTAAEVENGNTSERILTVIVKDTGVGISDVKRAMEPMFTTAPDGERSGMGFSFMEAFMDELEVSSVPGEGTTVIMRKRIGR